MISRELTHQTLNPFKFLFSFLQTCSPTDPQVLHSVKRGVPPKISRRECPVGSGLVGSSRVGSGRGDVFSRVFTRVIFPGSSSRVYRFYYEVQGTTSVPTPGLGPQVSGPESTVETVTQFTYWNWFRGVKGESRLLFQLDVGVTNLMHDPDTPSLPNFPFDLGVKEKTPDKSRRST